MPEWTEGDGTSRLDRRVRDSARGFDVRRAVAGSVAGVALMAGPVGLARMVVPADGADIQAGESQTLFASLNRDSDMATELSQVNLNETLAAQEATVSEKPFAATTTSTTTTTTTAPPDEAENRPPDNGGGFGDPQSYATWDALADCETGGNWSTNTGNGYYGGIQFSLATWQSVGGSGYPHENSREEQIYRGQVLQARAGWGQWPSCAAQLGLL